MGNLTRARCLVVSRRPAANYIFARTSIESQVAPQSLVKKSSAMGDSRAAPWAYGSLFSPRADKDERSGKSTLIRERRGRTAGLGAALSGTRRPTGEKARE